MASSYPVLDTHIHLFRPKDLDTLAWQSPQGPLYGSYDLSEYLSATSQALPSFSGFIFVETDRKYTDPKDPSEDQAAWKHVLEEYRYVLQLSKHDTKGKKLVRGIVPWAPIHLGRAAMERYQKALAAVDTEVYGDQKHGLLVGYRYLLQDKPKGTGIASAFIEGLGFLRDTGMVFDLGIDTNRNGLWQFEEALEALKQVDGLRVVINHLSKPPLGRTPEGGLERWVELMEEAAKFDVAIKFSGAFSELPPGMANENEQFPEDKLVDMVLDYARPIFRIFGPRRIVWGSDWPVCGIGYEEVMGQQHGAWQDWFRISTKVMRQIQDEGEVNHNPIDWDSIWGLSAIKIYNLPATLD
ncbi:hypothetical protein ABW20_dc0101320 [Dactylellina cionopaga]|nr:hypothetical protein ABW20_dc0101320 [Dactylellina cionopaga]